jgi:hypothetical protein
MQVECVGAIADGCVAAAAIRRPYRLAQYAALTIMFTIRLLLLLPLLLLPPGIPECVRSDLLLLLLSGVPAHQGGDGAGCCCHQASLQASSVCKSSMCLQFSCCCCCQVYLRIKEAMELAEEARLLLPPGVPACLASMLY